MRQLLQSFNHRARLFQCEDRKGAVRQRSAKSMIFSRRTQNISVYSVVKYGQLLSCRRFNFEAIALHKMYWRIQ